MKPLVSSVFLLILAAAVLSARAGQPASSAGLLFVAKLVVSAAVAGGLIADAVAGSGAPGPDILALGRQLTSLLLHVYGMRMAAVFTMSTATITLRTKVVPRWIGMLGIAVAVVLLVSVGLTVWVELLFPAWILLLSIDILRTGLRRSRAAAGTAMGPQALSMLATGCHRDSLANTARLLSHSRPLSDSLSGRVGQRSSPPGAWLCRTGVVSRSPMPCAV